MQDTKLSFSSEELDAMRDGRFFVVKNSASQKIVDLLGELEKELSKKISGLTLPGYEKLNITNKGKIFRGENYRLMPYLILDCPRLFKTEAVFAFRSMFRWGNEFSFTLHLQGEALEIFRKKIQQNILMLNHKDFFFCVNDTPWEYTYDESNYISLDELLVNRKNELDEMLAGKNFLKFSRRLKLEEYERLITYGMETFDSLVEVLR